MDRRAFLRRSTAVAAGLVAADQLDVIERIGWTRRLFSGFGGGIPTLYGDGVHDDTLALQAIIDGKRVRDPNRRHRTTEGRVHIGNGFFRLTDTIRLGGGRPPVTMTNNHFELAHGLSAERPVFLSEGWNGSTASYCVFDGRH